MQERWSAIHAELPETPVSVLDAGCNAGFYVIESAKLGHFAAGLDSPEFAIVLTIVKNALGLPNVLPIPMTLDPDNVRSLPTFDVVIVLQVFHHLCAAYGADEASGILRQLWGKSRRKLIFETEPSARAEEPFRSAMPDMGNDSEAWVRGFFRERGCGDVRVIYRDEKRHRSVFVIERKRGALSRERA